MLLSWKRCLILHRGQVCKIPILVGRVRECQTSNGLLLAADVRCSGAILLGDVKQRLILIWIIVVKPLMTLVVLLLLVLLVVDMQIIFLVPSVIE